MDLFSQLPKENNDDYLQRQLIKLGDMMGDGLHHEPDGKWIEKEYTAIAKRLYPEAYVDASKRRTDARNEQMKEILKENKCTCGGILKQTRSGAKVAACMICGTRYKVSKKK